MICIALGTLLDLLVDGIHLRTILPQERPASGTNTEAFAPKDEDDFLKRCLAAHFIHWILSLLCLSIE